MNAALMLVYNRTPEQLELTKAAIASVLAQDIPVALTVIDNGSTGETRVWLDDLAADNPANINLFHHDSNTAPTKLANLYLAHLFVTSQHILCLPNDVILPPHFYREILKWPRGIVTASETRDRTYDLSTPADVVAISENTPMAVMLVRKWMWEAVMAKDGYFLDEGLFHYCSDCCLAVRMAACGIRGIQLNIPYWHSGSASWRLADPEAARIVHTQADADRAFFQRKYGFAVDSVEYGRVAVDPNWRG